LSLEKVVFPFLDFLAEKFFSLLVSSRKPCCKILHFIPVVSRRFPGFFSQGKIASFESKMVRCSKIKRCCEEFWKDWILAGKTRTQIFLWLYCRDHCLLYSDCNPGCLFFFRYFFQADVFGLWLDEGNDLRGIFTLYHAPRLSCYFYRQIDRLVYDLYGLTEEEMKIVEQD